jgi:hypothetical protein
MSTTRNNLRMLLEAKAQAEFTDAKSYQESRNTLLSLREEFKQNLKPELVEFTNSEIQRFDNQFGITDLNENN